MKDLVNPEKDIYEIVDWMLKPDHVHDDDSYLQRACYMHRAYELKELLKKVIP